MADVDHCLAAAGIAVAQLAGVGRVGQHGQTLFHILPVVRVATLALGQHAGVFQVTEAHVVGGQRHPGAARLGDARRDTIVGVAQVVGASQDALGRVGAITDTHLASGVVGEHHQTLHPGGGDGTRIPQGFLVGQGSQQTPVKAAVAFRLAEQFLIAGQTIFQVTYEAACCIQVELFHMAVETVFQLGGSAVGLGLSQVALGSQVQALVILGVERPSQRHVSGGGVIGDQLGPQGTLQGIVVGMDQGVIHLAVFHQSQQLFRAGFFHLLEFQARIFQLRLYQQFRVA